MSKLDQFKCLICSERCKKTIPLNQCLTVPDKLTVGEALENLQFLTLSGGETCSETLCLICASKVLACYEFKTKCRQVGKALEITPAVPHFLAVNEMKFEEENFDNNEATGRHNPIAPQQPSVEKDSVISTEDLSISTKTSNVPCGINIANLKGKLSSKLKGIGAPQKQNMEDISIACDNKIQVDNETKVGHIIKEALDAVKHKAPKPSDIAREITVAIRDPNIENEEINPHEQMFSCTICQKRFKEEQHLKKHSLTHAGNKLYVCDVCDESFERRPHLFLHRGKHVNKKLYVCNICNKSFRSLKNVTKHKQIHYNEWLYGCKICKISFRYYSSYLAHCKTVHPREKPHTCGVCNKSFIFWCDLKQHKSTHTNTKRYVCDVCNKRFNRFKDLSRHKSMHISIPRLV